MPKNAVASFAPPSQKVLALNYLRRLGRFSLERATTRSSRRTRSRHRKSLGAVATFATCSAHAVAYSLNGPRVLEACGLPYYVVVPAHLSESGQRERRHYKTKAKAQGVVDKVEEPPG